MIRFFFLVLCCFFVLNVHAQKEKNKDIDYDELFSELDAFLDSLTAPRNMFIVNVGVSTGFFNYHNQSSTQLITNNKLVISPSAGYFHKSGLGLTAGATAIKYGDGLNPFQYFLSPSLDYHGGSDFFTGISFIRYFTKESLPFYTTPIDNELSTYFTYNNWWVKPTVSASYGWGSRSELQQREEQLKKLRSKKRQGNPTTVINTIETVSDISLATSVRHDFYWLNVITERDFFRVTPQLTLTSGTQNFGFNQTTSTYNSNINKNKSSNGLFTSENVQLDDKVNFQPLSLAALLKTEFSVGKVYLQPQVMFDYYFPALDNKLSKIFSVNAGVHF